MKSLCLPRCRLRSPSPRLAGRPRSSSFGRGGSRLSLPALSAVKGITALAAQVLPDGTPRRAQRNRGLGLVALVYCGYSRSIELDAPIQQLKGLAQPKRSLARVGEEMQITLECPSGGDEE